MEPATSVMAVMTRSSGPLRRMRRQSGARQTLNKRTVPIRKNTGPAAL